MARLCVAALGKDANHSLRAALNEALLSLVLVSYPVITRNEQFFLHIDYKNRLLFYGIPCNDGMRSAGVCCNGNSS